MKTKFWVVLALSVVAISSSKAQIVPEAQKGYSTITATDLKEHLTFMASPGMEGRETSFPGEQKTADYIAAQFKKFGLKPLADDGSYFQEYLVQSTRPNPEFSFSLRTESGEQQYRFGKDFIALDMRDTVITRPCAFMGYFDSYIDAATRAAIKGKYVIVFGGKRESKPDTGEMRILLQFQVMRNYGGEGLLIVTDESQYGPIAAQYSKWAGQFEKGTMSISATGKLTTVTGLPFYLISSEMASKLLASTGKSVEELRTIARDTAFRPILLENTELSMHARAIREIRKTRNIAGFIPGADKGVDTEYVFFTAHFDHLGKMANGDVMCGADDNASGTSSVLELARAFAANETKPKRNLVFMCVSGEEKGLLGSQYYVKHPIVPLARISALINIDMIGRTDAKYTELNNPQYVYSIGSKNVSHTLDSLMRTANAASVNIAIDYRYDSETDPNQFYRRSDHYNFGKNGVPIVFFFDGMHADYHKPTDTIDKIDFEKMASITKLAYTLGWNVSEFSSALPREKSGK